MWAFFISPVTLHEISCMQICIYVHICICTTTLDYAICLLKIKTTLTFQLHLVHWIASRCVEVFLYIYFFAHCICSVCIIIKHDLKLHLLYIQVFHWNIILEDKVCIKRRWWNVFFSISSIMQFNAICTKEVHTYLNTQHAKSYANGVCNGFYVGRRSLHLFATFHPITRKSKGFGFQ